MGEWLKVVGDTPRNRVLEFMLEGREMDYSIGDVAKETKVNRATTYNMFSSLINFKILVKSRKSSGAQLYKLNLKSNVVNMMLKSFDAVLHEIINQEIIKNKTKS